MYAIRSLTIDITIIRIIISNKALDKDVYLAIINKCILTIRQMICNEALNRYLYIKFDYITEIINYVNTTVVDITCANKCGLNTSVSWCYSWVKFSFTICFFVSHPLYQRKIEIYKGSW